MGVGPGSALTLFAAVLSGHLVVGWTNDLGGRERIARVGRLDKPLAAGEIAVGLVLSAIGAAGVVSVLTSLLCGLAAGPLHLLAVHGLAPTTVPPLAALTLVAATVVAVFGSRTSPTDARWILLAVVFVLAVAATRTTGKTPFYAAIAIAGVNVVMLLIG